MSRSRVSLGALFLVLCGWPEIGAQVPTKTLPTAALANKAIPQDVHASVQQPTLWVNLRPHDLSRDMAEAAELGVGPIRITTPRAVAEIGAGGRVFKWVISKEGELLGLPRFGKGDVVRGHVIDKDDVIKHPVATGGRPVYAAGLARAIGDKIFVDRYSGHYQPAAPSLQIAKRKFEAAGFRVATVEDGVQ